jgi:hypothetical protein
MLLIVFQNPCQANNADGSLIYYIAQAAIQVKSIKEALDPST